jgi:hypothetical protein
MPVYFIRQGLTGPVKIGVAGDVVKRLRQLQTNQPITLHILRVLDGDRSLEAALHEKFSLQRLSGEWFNFSDDMLKSGHGADDLPIPHVKRNYGRNYFVDSAHGRQSALHEEILAIIGGADTLARRLKLPPWEVVRGNINQNYWSAAILLLNDVGRSDITLDMMFAARDEVIAQQKKIDEQTALGYEQQRARWDAEKEQKWVEKHGAGNAWWPLSESQEGEEDAPLDSTGSSA